MSFELWVSAFANEETAWLPAKAIRHRFAPLIAGEDDGTFPLRFPDGPSLARLYLSENDAGRMDGFTIGRPPDFLVFWEVIAGILRDFPCVLYWPSEPARACMGSLDLLPHLPADFLEVHGVPYVSTDASEVRNYVRDNQ